MSWYDDVVGFVTENKDVIKPIAQVGLGALKNTQNDSATKDYINYLKSQEQTNYQNYLADVDAYNAAGADAAANANARAAAAAANSRARAAAAAATERNRLKAAKKASKEEQKGYAEALALMAPYVQAGEKVLPAKTGTYLDALKRMSAIGQTLDTKKADANASIPSWEVPVQLPDYLMRK